MKLAMLAVEKSLALVDIDSLPEETCLSGKANSFFSNLPVSEGSKSISTDKNTPLGYQILQIHDSIMVECPRQNAEIVSKMLVETMENIHPQLGIKLKVDVKIGNNWSEV